MGLPRLRPDDTAILVVDMQQRLVPVMHESEALVQNVSKLVEGAAALEAPLLMTEQYPRGLGGTIDQLTGLTERAHCRAEKTCFSGYVERVQQTLEKRETRCVAVAGIEAHVCLQQTCLELQDRGYIVGAVLDATSSRQPRDRELAEQRLIQAGIVPLSVEALLMELVQDAAAPAFKALRPIIK
jgi:nicotinamidase-related amidase